MINISPTFSPADGSTGAATDSNIVVAFNDAIARGTGNIEIRSGSASGALVESFDAAISSRVSVSGSALTIDPTNNLANDTQYFVTFAAGAVKDLAGNAYAGTTSYDFRTLADTLPPTVSTFSPADGATGVTASSNIALTLSEAVQRGAGLIELRSGSATGTLVESFDAATSLRISISGSTLTIDPTNNLASDTSYFVTFASGTIKDLAGNAYAGTTSYDFRTADVIDPTVQTFTPADGTTGVSASANIALTFSETIQRGVGTITLRSGSATGTVVESFDAATSSRITVSGSTLTIDPTSSLAANTQYFVVFTAGTIKDIAGNAYAGTSTYDFTTAAAANSSLPAMPNSQITGDFNGDGRDDILWRNDAGQLSNWLGKANGGFVGNDANAFVSGVPLSWKVVGTGDFNGDGRDDILWRNDITGELSDWLGKANGGFVGNDANAFVSGVPLSWHVVGTGDFNGDGRADILWRSDAGQLSNWLGKANGGFVGNDANALNSVPLDWQVVGTGDYNGDGREDILWRNAVTGELSDWLGQANGGFVGNDANAFVSGVPLSWNVQGIDFRVL